ncbi:flagellin [Conexibacter sp. SYSU D00693]|uniref:flagellin N-terminal helical domain-containing protein n=1 Tax=Conexibacter sp. SYSU D00693 TaxID=2812560 RepID=UPI00196B0175|nr:flagellin [Conexibacter sp. SYSU D00693]
MRITQGMLNNRLLSDAAARQAEIAATQREIATGRRLNRPSDDPLQVREALVERSTVSEIEGHRRSATSATSRLDATDSSLGQLSQLIQRAKELAIQAANGTVDAKDRETMALEVDQIAEAAKDAVRVQVDGAWIFSGTDSTTPPYAFGSDTFAGNAATVAREIGPGVSVGVNVSAASVLGSGQGAADGLLLNTLRDLADHLRGGTPADLAALRGADLAGLTANLDTVNAAQATVGAAQVRVDAAVARLDDLDMAGQTRLRDLEGADLAEALTRLTTQKTAYEAALKTGAQLFQLSLLDFLR